MIRRTVLLGAVLAPLSILARLVTVVNNCESTIWPQVWEQDIIYTAGGGGNATGWRAAPKFSKTVQLKGDFSFASIWARQACTSGQGPTLKCAAGDCDPGLSDSTGLKCTSFPVAASFTATIGRLTFQTDQDGYYVSLHTGFNLPMSIQTNSDCPDVDCPTNFIVSCPKSISGNPTADGLLTCRTSCQAELGNATQALRNCCLNPEAADTGTCDYPGTQFYNWYHSGCPNAVILRDDKPNRCPSSKATEYTVTFCPANAATIAAPKNDFASASTSVRSVATGTAGKSTGVLSLTSSSSVSASANGTDSARMSITLSEPTSTTSSLTSTGSNNSISSATPTEIVLAAHTSQNLSHGSIVGIVFGALLFCALFILAMLLIIRRHRRTRAQVDKPEGRMSQLSDTSTTPATVLPSRGEQSLAQRNPSTSKRALLNPGVSSAATIALPATIASQGSSGRVEHEQDFEERFQERFPARLIEFLDQHMDPPPANPASERGEADLPAYPGTRR